MANLVNSHLLEQIMSLHPFLLSTLLFFLSIILHNFFRRSKRNLPPSPPKLPIIGNLHQLGTLPHRSFRELSRKYGPLMFLHIGHAPTLVVSSAELAQEMVKNHDVVFSNRPITTAVNILLYGCKDFGFAPYGDYWRQARKICVLQLLSLKRVQSFHFAREEEVSVMIDKIRGECAHGGAIDLSEMLLGTSHNIISRCVIGRKGDEEVDGGCHFGELTRKFMRQISEFNVGDMYPCLGWLDVITGFIGRLKSTSKEMDAFLDQVIEEHMTSECDINDDQDDRKDFVQILLQHQKDDMFGSHLARDNLKAILADMFVAGTESVATATEWAMAELMRHPKIMKKAQEEVRGVVGKKPKIDAQDIDQMKYLKCIVKETLRLHPPAPLMSPRLTSASAKLGGYDIPPKTKVLVNVWAIQRDPKLWDMPEEFVPERFENGEVDFKGQNFEFIPFGMGRRSCPGMSFGVVAVEYVIANLLHWFNWKLPHNMVAKDLDMSEAFGLGVCMKSPLHLLPIPYSPRYDDIFTK